MPMSDVNVFICPTITQSDFNDRGTQSSNCGMKNIMPKLLHGWIFGVHLGCKKKVLSILERNLSKDTCQT